FVKSGTRFTTLFKVRVALVEGAATFEVTAARLAGNVHRTRCAANVYPKVNRLGWGGRMELDDRALPLTRGQLDIWLAQETGHSGTEWQLAYFVRIEGTVERDALEWVIRRAVQEAEPARAAFF